ncbi:cation efflux family-domain-containing protein [Spinellus fusiger]|nr:cation efflux family-domain-containing protein [Spinellus fusiger]
MSLTRQTRIFMMLFITGGFFIAEIVIGYYVRSLALVADSFHMLNDMLALGVALWAIRIAVSSQWDSKYSYGWQRAEILGALINGVFLLALCFTIVINAIERFIYPEPITNPVMVLITGCVGLAGNILGLFLFHEHGHGHGHRHKNKHEHEHEISHHSKEAASSDHSHSHTHSHPDSHAHGGHLNMKGIFLHVLGDALGNVGVIVTALFIWLTPYPWRFYMDPIISLVISVIIFFSAMPLVRQTSAILLQGVPASVDLDQVHSDLLNIPYVLSVHELHIWQLSDTKLIASLHVLLDSQSLYMVTASHLRKILHGHGVHSVTIQPEFKESAKHMTELAVGDACLLTDHSSVTEHPTVSSTHADTLRSREVRNFHIPYETTCLLRCTDTCSESTCCPDTFGPP